LEKPLGVLRHIPVIRSLKRLAKVSAWLLGIAGTLIAGAFLVFTFLILPRLDHYRPDLERAIGQTVGRKVTIGRLSGYWEGVAPRLDLHHLSIADPSGSPLTFDQVSIVPSWLSLAVFEARLALIEVHGPSINVRRDTDGQIYLNGFRLAGKGGNGNAGNWLLRQGHISIVDARISWEDKLFGMPRLTLDQGRLDFTSGLLGHHLSLFGRPPATIGDSVELVGDWRGDDLQHWNKWNGSLTSTLHGAKVSAWNRYMQSFGLVRSGEGDGSISVTFADGHINSLVADVKVKNAAYTLPGASELTLPAFGGRLQVDRGGDIYRITASRLTLMSASGPIFDNSSISGFWNAGRVGGGELQVDNVNLSYLQPLLHALGVDRNPLFARFAPGGQLKNLSVQWDGKIEAPTRYRIESGFTRLSWNPFGQVPGVRGVAGKASFDQNGGTLTLTGADEVRMPNVFPRPLHFTALDADVSWKNSAAGIALRLSRIRFANDDMHGQLSGTYRRHGAGAGTIDLAGSVDRVAATRVVDYLPYQAGQDTLRWLTMALKGGTLQNTRLRLSGDLDHFPFKGGKGGVFEVGGDVHDGRLLFDKDWPELDGIEARLQFRNERMDVLPTRASTLGMSLSRVKVSIPDLSAAVAQLQIDGHAEGDLAHMLRYTTKSPVDGWLGGFTGKVRADGRAMLDLGLIVPLSGNNDARVKGRVQFLGNRLDLTSLPLPTLDAVTGALDFTERGVASRGVRLRAFGGPFTLTASTDAAGHMHFGVDGQADSAKVIGRYVPQLASHVSGQSRYQARFSIHDGLEFLQIGSSMAGSRLDAPPPLGKPAAASMPLNVTLIPFTHASGARLDFSLGRQLSGRLRLDSHGDAQAAVIALGRPLGALPASGVTIKAALPVIDLQTWGDWMQSHSAGAPTTPLHVELATPELRWGSYVIHGASIWVGHEPADTHWHVMVDAAEIKGEIDYDTSDNGAIRARLPLLVLTPLAPGQSAVPSLSQYKVHSLPGLDVRVGKLVYRGITLGSLNLFARYSDRDWLLDNISLKTPEGTLSGSVRVHGATASVESRFLASATDIGKLLARFGVKDSFERGHGTIAGSLAWPGGLADFDLARVSGQLSTSLADGRFAKINPGVARLLGVLSLQSLPRRIHLDFTDVFSEGFTFDSLKGDANITQGVFHTGNVEMKGPGADVSIRGDINLAAETQQLAVHVEPHLSESVALATGAALINPVVGVAALAAQKVLRDPVSKIFSVDYNVSGTFAEPQVTRVSRPVVKNPTRKTPR
jgi:uncharacterized protein (TIGR02099 family)